MRKFEERVNEILVEAKDNKAKYIKALSDPKVWDDAKKEIEDDFKKDYEKSPTEWAEGIHWQVSRRMKKKHKLDKKNQEALDMLIRTYSYELESRGL